MLTLNTATTKECPHDFGSWCCINIPTLVTKCSVIQKISSGQIFTDVSTLHCDLDLEHSNPIFSQDTPAYDAVLSYQVWLQTIQQFRGHNGHSVLHSETYRGSSLQNPVWRHCPTGREAASCWYCCRCHFAVFLWSARGSTSSFNSSVMSSTVPLFSTWSFLLCAVFSHGNQEISSWSLLCASCVHFCMTVSMPQLSHLRLMHGQENSSSYKVELTKSSTCLTFVDK